MTLVAGKSFRISKVGVSTGVADTPETFFRETLCESGRWIDALKKGGRVLKKRGRVLKKRGRVLKKLCLVRGTGGGPLLQKGGGGFLRRGGSS